MSLIQAVCPKCIALHADKLGAHSAVVGALTPKPKQKLLICKNIVHIATSNVRNFNTVNQLPELTTSDENYTRMFHTVLNKF